MDNNALVPTLYFDGQFIDVLWDNHRACVEWFEKYFGWHVNMQENWMVDPRCIEGKMTQMDCGTWIVSYLTNTKLPHHFAERGTVESNIRLCFTVQDLEKLHKTFSEAEIRVSPIYNGPKSRYFDVWATCEGIRLTLQENPSAPTLGLLPSWVRIGVSNLEHSIKWYEKHMGMKVIENDEDNKFIVTTLKLNHSEDDSLWILEQLPEGTYTGKINGQVQPYCWIQSREDFFQYHQYLNDSGVETSDIGGFITRGMVSFHFYDLDGNRINVSSM